MVPNVAPPSSRGTAPSGCSTSSGATRMPRTSASPTSCSTTATPGSSRGSSTGARAPARGSPRTSPPSGGERRAEGHPPREAHGEAKAASAVRSVGPGVARCTPTVQQPFTSLLSYVTCPPNGVAEPRARPNHSRNHPHVAQDKLPLADRGGGGRSRGLLSHRVARHGSGRRAGTLRPGTDQHDRGPRSRHQPQPRQERRLARLGGLPVPDDRPLRQRGEHRPAHLGRGRLRRPAQRRGEQGGRCRRRQRRVLRHRQQQRGPRRRDPERPAHQDCRCRRPRARRRQPGRHRAARQPRGRREGRRSPVPRTRC